MNVRSSFKDLVLRFLVEFAVIVVGVLVALGIDSWASDQAVRSEEVDAKRLLRAEFLSNLPRLRYSARPT